MIIFKCHTLKQDFHWVEKKKINYVTLNATIISKCLNYCILQPVVGEVFRSFTNTKL